MQLELLEVQKRRPARLDKRLVVLPLLLVTVAHEKQAGQAPETQSAQTLAATENGSAPDGKASRA
jgi:hypothetical protein